MTEESHYYHTLVDFMDLIREHGMDKLMADMTKMAETNLQLLTMFPK